MTTCNKCKRLMSDDFNEPYVARTTIWGATCRDCWPLSPEKAATDAQARCEALSKRMGQLEERCRRLVGIARNKKQGAMLGRDCVKMDKEAISRLRATAKKDWECVEKLALENTEYRGTIADLESRLGNIHAFWTAPSSDFERREREPVAGTLVTPMVSSVAFNREEGSLRVFRA